MAARSAGARNAPSGISPRYQQVKDYLLSLINSGEIGPADRVPSENEISRDLGVSRMTVNRGVKELADEGYLVRIPGVGTFVADQTIHSHPLEIRNIADEIRRRGHEHSAKVIKLHAVKADARLAARCNVPAKSTLHHSLIVHYENELPLQVEDRHVVPEMAPGYLDNDFAAITPFDFLIRIAPLHMAEHAVRAIIPSQKIRKLLAMRDDEACLLVMRRTFTANRVVSVADLYHAGSRYDLTGKAEAVMPGTR